MTLGQQVASPAQRPAVLRALSSGSILTRSPRRPGSPGHRRIPHPESPLPRVDPTTYKDLQTGVCWKEGIQIGPAREPLPRLPLPGPHTPLCLLKTEPHRRHCLSVAGCHQPVQNICSDDGQFRTFVLLEIRQERVNKIVYPTPHLQEERKRTFNLKLQGREGWARPAARSALAEEGSSVISAVSRKAAGRFLHHSSARAARKQWWPRGFTHD